MDQNKFYKILYKRIIKGGEQEFTYKGIYLGREGVLISFNEISGQKFLNDSNCNLIEEITDPVKIVEIQAAIDEREKKERVNLG